MTEHNTAKQVWTTPSLETLEMKDTAVKVNEQPEEFEGGGAS